MQRKSEASALALKEVLGRIELEQTDGECVVENGNLVQVKPYYVAYSNIQTLALIEENKGSNWLHCRTRSSPIRTSASLPVQIKLPLKDDLPLYQKLAPKIKQLKALGLTHQEITQAIGVSKKTIKKSLYHSLSLEKIGSMKSSH